MKFAVCVTFKIAPDHWEDFLELMHANAAMSLEKEDGCLQFDVCTDDTRPNEVFLYEIYGSPESFQLHLQSDHFQDFDANVSGMIETKQVATYSSVR